MSARYEYLAVAQAMTTFDIMEVLCVLTGKDTYHLEANGHCQLGKYLTLDIVKRRVKSAFLHP